MSADPYRYFRVEAHDLLAELRNGALQLSRGVDVVASIRRILRAAHTFKSAARVVRLRELGDHAHAIEDLLAPVREDEAALPTESARALEAHLAAIALGLEAIEDRAAPAQGAPERTAQDVVRVVRADVQDVDRLVDGLGTLVSEIASLRRSVDDASRSRHLVELLLHQSTPALASSSTAEELLATLGGLERGLGNGLDRVVRELGQARDSAERLRLVPATVLLDAVERTVIDAGRTLGKRVAFRSQGGDVRLDAHVLGLAQSALVQIVRNAVAHGIEPESERRSLGKPAEGLVSIEVARRANRITFTCRDDGRGIDLEAVRRAARRKSATSAVDQKSAAELLEMLLHGGLSTSSTVTAISGRGVGMDVVRTAAERLGGEVRVRTHAQHGTEIVLSLPMLLSSLDVMLFRAGDQTFGVSVEAVRGARRVTPADIAATADGSAILEAGRAISFAPLVRCLGLSSTASSARAASAIIVATGEDEAALGVDALLGLSHVLLRPLPDLVPNDGAIAGIALDASGDAIVVLDAAHLIGLARRAPRAVSVARDDAPILVVDDSLTTRMLEQSILESAGYEVELAVSGEDALTKLEHGRHALVLVDVEMPGIDGFEVIRRIRADARVRHVPAILVTSRDAPEDRALGREVGASDYVVKGEFDQSLLLKRIRELLRRAS